jgi:hypothetical protein
MLVTFYCFKDCGEWGRKGQEVTIEFDRNTTLLEAERHAPSGWRVTKIEVK